MPDDASIGSNIRITSMSRLNDLKALADSIASRDWIEATAKVERLISEVASSHTPRMLRQQTKVPAAVTGGFAHPPVPPDLRITLDALRVERGISTTTLARRAGFSDQHIAGVLSGRRAPSVSCAEAIADALLLPTAGPHGVLRARLTACAAEGVGRDKPEAAESDADAS